MDILIKGLEMPKEKDDVVILTIQPDGTTNIFGRRLLSLLRPSAEIHGLRKCITTAIEIPPHDDLISRKALYEAMREHFGCDCCEKACTSDCEYMGSDFYLVWNAPTVLEATE